MSIHDFSIVSDEKDEDEKGSSNDSINSSTIVEELKRRNR